MLAHAIRRPVILSGLALLLAATALLALDLPALWDRLVVYGVQMQRDLHRELAVTMRALQASEGTTFWSLIGLGFFYGAFHAVGPGHGKVVISTYLATHESRLTRGITLSFLSSLAQGLTAILLVGGVALVAERSLRDSQSLGIGLEVVSYGLVMLIGLFLVWRSTRRLMTAHRHSGHTSCGCGHGHGPSAHQLETAHSFREYLAMILSIGMRPCSGAILVLVLAFALGQLPAGVAAVVAMSLGTGLSVSLLATLSVYARKGAFAFAAALETEGQSVARLADMAAILGGLLIIVFGGALLNASLSVSQHPLL